MVGRPEKPLALDGTPLVDFANDLRQLRSAAGLTYGELSTATNYSTSTLQEACSGRRLPTLEVTLAFVAACGGDTAEWEKAHARLANELNAVPQTVKDIAADPDEAEDEPELRRLTAYGRYRRIAVIAGVTVAVGLVIGGALISTSRDDQQRTRSKPTSPSSHVASRSPQSGIDATALSANSTSTPNQGTTSSGTITPTSGSRPSAARGTTGVSQSQTGTTQLPRLGFAVTGSCTSAGGALSHTSANFTPGRIFTVSATYPSGAPYPLKSAQGTVNADGTVPWIWTCSGDPPGQYSTTLIDVATGRSTGAVRFYVLAAPATPITISRTVQHTSDSPPDGVWFNNAPRNGTSDKVDGHGVYMGDVVRLDCYAFGDAGIGAQGETLWYKVANLNRPTVPGSGAANTGFLNSYYIQTGQLPSTPVAGVPQC